MGDIIKFPMRTVRGWTEIEQTLRAIFTQAFAPIEMQNAILIRMKEVFQRYNVDFGVSFELPAFSPEQQEAVDLSLQRALECHEKRLQDFMNQVFLERLQLEIELYKLRYE